MNIYLIGYRCCGKTSLGLTLAGMLGWDFIDTDLEVTGNAAMDVAAIVAREGWDGFRQREKQVLWRVSRLDRKVVATGGGIVVEKGNVAVMRESGVVVWLKASPEVIARRMSSDPATAAMRPALTGLDLETEIRNTLERRRPLYAAAADLELDTGQAGVEELGRRLSEFLVRIKNVQ